MAFRNLKRQWFHAWINITGLAVGIACTFVITLFLREELSFDRHHSNASQIYRIAHNRALNGSVRNMSTTPLFLGDKLKTDFASVDQTVRFMQETNGSFKVEDRLNPEPSFCFTDAGLLEMFDIPLIYGNPQGALSKPNSLLLSEEMAVKYFANENPVGETMTWVNWGRETPFEVTGVFANIPETSHFQFDFFVPYDSEINLWKGMHGQDWHYSGAWTYVQLSAGTDPADLQEQLTKFASTELPAPLDRSTEFFLQPLTDIHLHSNLSNEIIANGSIGTVYIFAVIALLVLIISCINFINLTTARALTRAKEVGIRKTLGAFRSSLIRQFLTEALVIGALSALMASILSFLAMPLFNNLAEKQISIMAPDNLYWLVLIPAIGLLAGMAGGIYPALLLSGFNPVRALKNQVYVGKNQGTILRKALVTFQFSISILLLIAVITVIKQINFLKSKELGFDKEQVVFINGYDWRQYQNLKTALEAVPGVIEVTGGNSLPGTPNANPIVRMARPETNADEDRLEVYIGSVDLNYMDLMGIDLSDGRLFSADLATDPNESILVNEAFLRQSGLTAQPLGAKIAQYDMMGNYANTKTIVGVLTDFHVESLHNQIKPLIYNLNPQTQFNTILKISPESFLETIEQVRSTAAAFSTGAPVDFYFLDRDIERLYSREDRLSKIIGIFTGLAIFISCLGLLGLASFTTAQKTKEIGIRKVLGASVASLLGLLIKQLTWLVLLAFLVAAPIAWFMADGWLNNFAYRISPGIETFALVIVASLLITWLTVGYQSLKAAIINPVKSLRDE